MSQKYQKWQWVTNMYQNKQSDDIAERLQLVRPNHKLPATPMVVLTVGYSRYSDDAQHYSSIERQQESITRTCDKCNLGQPIMYKDEAVSGRLAGRAGINKAIEFMAEHPGSNFVVESADRIFRSMKAFTKIFDALLEHNAKVFDSDGLVNPDFMPFLAGMSALEIKKLKMRTMGRKRQMVREGAYLGGDVFGYDREGSGRLRPSPDEAPIVREIFEMRAGGASLGEIRRWLYDQNIPSPTGKPAWHRATISRILNNPMYCGFTAHTSDYSVD